MGIEKYTARPELAKKLLPISYILSVAVIALIAIMGVYKIETDIDFSGLPFFHSIMNACTFVVLLIALYFIKQGNIEAHKKTMILAMILSAIFLVTYVLYHITTPPVKFGYIDGVLQDGVGTIRTIYLTILNTHILLAGIVFPFILISFIRGISYQIEKHKKLVRWVYPIWLYVTLTGPILFYMLRPYR